MIARRVNVPDDCFEHGGIHEVRDQINICGVRDHCLMDSVQNQKSSDEELKARMIASRVIEVVH